MTFLDDPLSTEGRRKMTPFIRPLGDSAAIVKWEDAEDAEICRAVRQVTKALGEAFASGVSEFEAIVPAFQSLTVHFCPCRTRYSDVVQAIEKALLVSSDFNVTARCVEIPVCFDAMFAPDLAEVALTHQLTPDELIHRFCSAEYSVRMIGFSPGFPYLSGLPAELATPRRVSPRLTVSQGSVAIGGRQAGIYPQETPGGWSIVGRTPLILFRAERLQPCLLTAGDQVRFFPIRVDQFQKWQDEQ